MLKSLTRAEISSIQRQQDTLLFCGQIHQKLEQKLKEDIKESLFLLFSITLATPHNIKYPNSPTRGQIHGIPLHWKHGVLAIGPPGKSQDSLFQLSRNTVVPWEKISRALIPGLSCFCDQRKNFLESRRINSANISRLKTSMLYIASCSVCI